MSINYDTVRKLLIGFNVDESYYEDMRLNGWTKEQLIDDLYDTHKEQGMTKEEAEMIVVEWLEPMPTLTPEEVEEIENDLDEE